MDGGQRLHGVGALSQQADIARLRQQQPQLLAGEGSSSTIRAVSMGSPAGEG